MRAVGRDEATEVFPQASRGSLDPLLLALLLLENRDLVVHPAAGHSPQLPVSAERVARRAAAEREDVSAAVQNKPQRAERTGIGETPGHLEPPRPDVDHAAVILDDTSMLVVAED
jgi:hypothetical protein